MIASLKKLWRLLSRREKRNAFLLSQLLLLNGLMEMVGVGIIPVYVGIVAYPERLIGNEYVQRLFSNPGEYLTQDVLLYWGSALFLLFFTLKTVFGVYISYIQVRFVHNRVLRLGDKLFTAYMRAPYPFHLDRNSAQLLRNINGECTLLGSSVLMPLVQLGTQFFVLAAISALLVAASPLFAVLALTLFIAIAGGVSGLLKNKFKQLGIEAQQARGDTVRSVNEGLGGVKEIRIMQREALFTERFRRSFGTTLSIQRFMQVISRAIPMFMEWVILVGLLVVVLIMFSAGKSSEVIVSTVVLFAVSLLRLKGAVSTIVGRFAGLQHSLVSVDTVYRDLQELDRPHLQGRGVVVDDDDGRPISWNNITIQNVHYRYPNAHQDALRDVTLNIRKGEAVGFVGATGAGKSTLLDIVLGVLEPTRGSLKLDDVDIGGDIDSWQRLLGYIPQSIYLVDGNIRENIALGLPKEQVRDESLWRAIRAAHLEDYIKQLPNGVDTIVGERGVRLSGGQRQRIAIARALYHDPDVLVMDEATSALDNVTERAVIRAVEELKGERTILMIAHRLTTVSNCDRIVVLENGGIDAVGSYDELMNSCEGFRKMAEA